MENFELWMGEFFLFTFSFLLFPFLIFTFYFLIVYEGRVKELLATSGQVYMFAENVLKIISTVHSGYKFFTFQ
jgi:hypothetical protein